jgi:hypothetical protein
MYKFKNTYLGAFEIFRIMNKTIKEPELINQLEGHILNNSSFGGLTYAEKNYNDKANYYDVISMYPFYMMSHEFQFPVKEGEFLTLTEKDFNELKYFKYGCYHVIIEKSKDENINKLFKFNEHKNNWYCHYDLKLARDLGLKMNIVNDNQSNFLYYSKEKLLNGRRVFGSTMKYLTDLKILGCPYVKGFYNNLWGSLAQRNKTNIYWNSIKNGDFDIHDDKYLIQYTEPKEKCYNIELGNRDSPYKSGFGRIGAFIQSFCRYKMAMRIKDYSKDIVYIHTDGVYLKNNVKLPIGEKIGDFKIKKNSVVHIKNINNFVWDE